MPFQPSPWMMGSALHGWKKELPHGLDLEPAEVILLHSEETSDKMTFRSKRKINFTFVSNQS